MKKFQFALFSFEEMISIISKKSIVNIIELNDCLCFLFQNEITASQMLDAMEIAKHNLIKRYPSLKRFENFEMKFTNGNDISKCKEEIENFVKKYSKKYGRYFLILPLPEKEKIKFKRMIQEKDM